ncbi:MAG: hypothetical protein KC464_02245, partial [Myxococcales bacterium]|nr:hypothetical protein [Myxococcales bacterium]
MADPADDAIEALLGDGDPEARRSFWRRFGEVVKRAAVATGQGTAWLARAGYDHRHYLPAVINGAVGDTLARRGDRLAIPMAFRDERGDLAIEALDATLGAGAGHVAVFVHGLMADDVYWREPFGDGEGLGPRLAREVGVTPLYLRYNSGRHISENGRALAALLARLVEHHGDRIERLSLVGHSMGGLVARSAGHYGLEGGHAWVARMRAMVLLGAPHDGSYLEQLGHVTTFVLDAIPTLSTRIIARVADGRSDGIKDLRDGVLVDEDWQDPGAARLGRRARRPVALLPGVDYHVVAGALGDDFDGLIASYLGDGLVGTRSALGPHVMCRVFPGKGHLALVGDPEVQA